MCDSGCPTVIRVISLFDNCPKYSGLLRCTTRDVLQEIELGCATMVV